jgi:hypothetical protein
MPFRFRQKEDVAEAQPKGRAQREQSALSNQLVELGASRFVPEFLIKFQKIQFNH